MTWMNTDITFPRHAKGFVIFRRSALGQTLHHAMQTLGESAVPTIAEILRTEIERVRPELDNCTLSYLAFDIHRFCWEMLVEHPSLPEVRDGETISFEALEPIMEAKAS